MAGAKRVEQGPPALEQDRDDVNLQFVEQPGPQQGLRRAGPVHHHSTIAGAARACSAHTSTSVTNRALPGGTSPSSM